jgi:hypothetical protein
VEHAIEPLVSDIQRAACGAIAFFPLAKLALGGDQYNETRVVVLALSDLRNELGHELDAPQLEQHFGPFTNTLGIFWPPNGAKGDAAQFQDARESCVKVAAFSCIGEVWIHIAERSLETEGTSFPAESAERIEAFSSDRSWPQALAVRSQPRSPNLETS